MCPLVPKIPPKEYIIIRDWSHKYIPFKAEEFKLKYRMKSVFNKQLKSASAGLKKRQRKKEKAVLTHAEIAKGVKLILDVVRRVHIIEYIL